MHSEKVKNKFYYNLFLILLTFGIVYFFIYPMYTGAGSLYSPKKGIKDLSKQKKDLTSALAVVKTYDDKLGEANRAYDKSLKDLPLDKLNTILPNSADPVLIAYEITKIASHAGSNMLLSGLSVREGQSDNKKYNTMTINFNTQGTYANLKHFLHELEISQRVYNVTSVGFSSAEDSTANSVYKYNFTVETYYLTSNQAKQ